MGRGARRGVRERRGGEEGEGEKGRERGEGTREGEDQLCQPEFKMVSEEGHKRPCWTTIREMNPAEPTVGWR